MLFKVNIATELLTVFRVQTSAVELVLPRALSRGEVLGLAVDGARLGAHPAQRVLLRRDGLVGAGAVVHGLVAVAGLAERRLARDFTEAEVDNLLTSIPCP